jgi:hypothetical protein
MERLIRCPKPLPEFPRTATGRTLRFAIAGVLVMAGGARPAVANEVAIEVLKLSYEGIELEGRAIRGGRNIAYTRAAIAKLLDDNKVADGTTEQFFTIEISEGRIANTVAVGRVFTVCTEKQKKLCMTARRLK